MDKLPFKRAEEVEASGIIQHAIEAKVGIQRMTAPDGSKWCLPLIPKMVTAPRELQEACYDLLVKTIQDLYPESPYIRIADDGDPELGAIWVGAIEMESCQKPGCRCGNKDRPTMPFCLCMAYNILRFHSERPWETDSQGEIDMTGLFLAPQPKLVQ